MAGASPNNTFAHGASNAPVANAFKISSLGSSTWSQRSVASVSSSAHGTAAGSVASGSATSSTKVSTTTTVTKSLVDIIKHDRIGSLNHASLNRSTDIRLKAGNVCVTRLGPTVIGTKDSIASGNASPSMPMNTYAGSRNLRSRTVGPASAARTGRAHTTWPRPTQASSLEGPSNLLNEGLGPRCLKPAV